MKSLFFVLLSVFGLSLCACSTSAEGSVGGKVGNAVENPMRSK